MPPRSDRLVADLFLGSRMDGSELHGRCLPVVGGDSNVESCTRHRRRFEEGLTRLSEGLSRPRAHTRIEKVLERIGRLKERSYGVAQHYTIEVLTDDSGRKATALTWRRRPRQG